MFLLYILLIFLLIVLILWLLKRDVKEHLVVVTSHYREDIEWLKKSGVQLVVCSKVEDSKECPRQANRGREATSYLQYIITNYDNLPDHVAFVHGHENAWHQGFKITLLEVIKCAKIEEYGFISLNNKYIDDRIMSNNRMIFLKSIWDDLFKPYLKREAPNYIYQDCCAQFIVSKERLRSIPKEAYEKWYEYIMKDEIYDDGGYELAIIFEFIWPIIFGDPDVLPLEEYKKRFKCRWE